MAERGGEYSLLVFRGNEHVIDEATHRLADRGDKAHDATVEPCHRGLGDPRDCVGEDLGEPSRARLDVDVRVLPDDDHRICRVDQLRRKVAVEVEEHPDARRLADHLADELHDVGLAVRDIVADHRAVKCQQHAVERQVSLDLGQELVSKTLVGRARRRSCRDGERERADLQLEPAPRCSRRVRAEAPSEEDRVSIGLGGPRWRLPEVVVARRER